MTRQERLKDIKETAKEIADCGELHISPIVVTLADLVARLANEMLRDEK